MSKQLIVNADDFGLTTGVNRGIITAFMRGIVTSATLMVNMPAFPDAVALAKKSPGLAVGLHLNLTYGYPVLPCNEIGSLLGAEGSFVKTPGFVLENGRVDEIRAEFWAQAKLFLATGLTLSHLDTHHHLHLSEKVLEPVAEIAKALGVTVRCLDERAMWAQGLPPKARFTKFFGDQDGVERLLTIINSLSDGVTEIPCHPGYVTEELFLLSTLNVVRERELTALIDPRVLDAVKKNAVSLTNYFDVDIAN